MRPAAETQPNRLASGGLVDRARPVDFTFDGRAMTGYEGDTLASALLAAGMRLVGRSFKYHRPRGILSAGIEEPNALVELGAGAAREPDSRATQIELFDGLAAASQNRWPSLKHDLLAVNSFLAPFIPAGFYYKTFMWPSAFWEKVYEPAIRRAAGLGRAAREADPARYERAFAFCDVLVVGSGPAGLAAALAAGRSGARVILCEQDFRLGGRLLAEGRAVDGGSGVDWAVRAQAELAAMPEVRILSRTSVFGAYDHGAYGAVERTGDHLAAIPDHLPRQRYWRIHARRMIVAAGAFGRPLVFGGNDRPGVMLAGAVRAYLNRFAVAPGRRAVVFTTNDDGLATARDLARHGVEIAAIVDPRPENPASKAAADASGARLYAGSVVTRAHGRHGVTACAIAGPADETHAECDLLAMSGGWDPALHLTSHLGHRPVWDDSLSAFVPDGLPEGMAVAGAASGRMDLAACFATGADAGAEAARACGFTPAPAERPQCDAEPVSVAPLWRVKASRGKAFVDFQNDVTDRDVALAAREGFRSVEHLKRYTTLGMATDQGKTANVNGLALMAEITERSVAETGTTTYRPPFAPVAIGALAGHARGPDFRPLRLTPSHEAAKEAGAVFVETGPWLRAQYFPRAGEADWLETVIREVKTVRSAVGLCDVSTLGKIDVKGPDAAAFMERVYINGWRKAKVGRVRYGVLLREDGFVMDDGTGARMAEDHFVVTTSTAHAPAVLAHMEFCQQCLWPELDVAFASISDHWAQYALAGPRSRDVLGRIVDPDHDLFAEAFPPQSCAAITLCGGLSGRLFGVSFSGELAYEIAVPARYGDALWRRILEAGADFDICPYGTEALSVMRIEKGHAASAEINGQTTAGDLGLAGMMSKTKDYVGRRMAGREALADPARPVLVGLKPVDPADRLTAGAHFLGQGAEATSANDEGYMTSAAFSPVLGHWIGLGFLAKGRERIGERIRAVDPLRGHDIAVEVAAPVFYDPDGERFNV